MELRKGEKGGHFVRSLYVLCTFNVRSIYALHTLDTESVGGVLWENS